MQLVMLKLQSCLFEHNRGFLEGISGSNLVNGRKMRAGCRGLPGRRGVSAGGRWRQQTGGSALWPCGGQSGSRPLRHRFWL